MKLIAYDRNAGDDYQPLIDHLKRIGARRVHYSLWEIDSPASDHALYSHLWPYFDAGDRLLVATVQGIPARTAGPPPGHAVTSALANTILGYRGPRG